MVVLDDSVQGRVLHQIEIRGIASHKLNYRAGQRPDIATGRDVAPHFNYFRSHPIRSPRQWRRLLLLCQACRHSEISQFHNSNYKSVTRLLCSVYLHLWYPCAPLPSCAGSLVHAGLVRCKFAQDFLRTDRICSLCWRATRFRQTRGLYGGDLLAPCNRCIWLCFDGLTFLAGWFRLATISINRSACSTTRLA